MKTKEMTKEAIEETNVKNETVNQWSARLPPEQQQFAFELWKTIHRADHNDMIEVRTIGDRLRATLIYLLRPRSRRTSGGFVPRGRCRWNCDGKVIVPAAREIVTRPDSIRKVNASVKVLIRFDIAVLIFPPRCLMVILLGKET